MKPTLRTALDTTLGLVATLPQRWRLRHVRSVAELAALKAQTLTAAREDYPPGAPDDVRLDALAELNRIGVLTYDSQTARSRTTGDQVAAVAAFVSWGRFIEIERYLQARDLVQILDGGDWRPYRMCAYLVLEQEDGPDAGPGWPVTRGGEVKHMGVQMSRADILRRFPVPRRVREELAGMWQICIADADWTAPRVALFGDLRRLADDLALV